MKMIYVSWALMSVGFLRGGLALHGYSSFGGTIWSKSMKTS